MKTMGSGEQANGCAQEFLGLWEKVWSRLESGGLRQEQDGASLARPPSKSQKLRVAPRT